jgi:molybdate transport system substrate-binding protein
LIEQGLADPATRSRVATNELVLIRPASVPSTLTWKTLGSLAPDDKLAIGEPGAVPAGRYAKEALQGLGLWDSLQDRIVLAGDVTMALAYARRGEVAAAAVYATDARAFDDVVVLDRANWDGAPGPEVISAAITSSTTGRSFLAFLDTPAARAVFLGHGFGPP